MGDRLNVLLIGGGGREHALAWKLKASPHIGDLLITPGNPGTVEFGRNVQVDLSDFKAVADLVKVMGVSVVVVGPEQPLVDGLADHLQAENIPVFGPVKEAAALEGSKSYAKSIMQTYGIPTAAYREFDASRKDELYRYLDEVEQWPLVLKADGLAAGKGVFICQDRQEARQHLETIENDEKLQKAAGTLVVEQYMQGQEASVFALCDGENARLLTPAQDHKRVSDGDTGPNTGGMGCFLPTPAVDEATLRRVDEEIVQPVLDAMKQEGAPYRGVLYCGLMLTSEGPKVLEFNCRFGDPECQVLMPDLQSDLLELVWAAVQGELDRHSVSTGGRHHCCVIMASEGYPHQYEKGMPISGLDQLPSGVQVFHSGTREEQGRLVTAGGRVLSVVGSGDNLPQAIEKSYAGVRGIHFDNAYYRTDIGQKGINQTK